MNKAYKVIWSKVKGCYVGGVGAGEGTGKK